MEVTSQVRKCRWGSIGVGLVVTVVLLMVSRSGVTAPARITPGVGIGPLTLGMRAADVQRVLRRQVTPRISGNQVVYDFPSLGLTAWANDNHVVRVRTRHPLHKTAAGIHPGLDWSDGILGMCGGIATTSHIPGGVEISCPFVGISFDVRDSEITSIAVMRPIRR